MRNFFELVGFEYKKMFRRRSTGVSLLLLSVIVIALGLSSVIGGGFWHSEGGTGPFEAMRQDRAAVQSRAGLIDEAFINEAIAQNAIMIARDDNYIINEYGKFLKNEAYVEHVLPYEAAVDIINVVYEADVMNLATDGFEIMNTGTAKPIDSLEKLSEDEFYASLEETIRRHIEGLQYISDAEKGYHLAMLESLERPFVSGYYGGFAFFEEYMRVVALALLVAVAICVSPIFAAEYQLRTDQNILSSKYGKSRAIHAKILTGVSFAVALAAIAMAGFLLLLLAIHGFGGAKMALQTMNTYSAYPVTMGQAALTGIGVTVLFSLFFSTIVMLLSAWARSPFAAVSVSFLILFLPAFINVSAGNRLLFQVVQVFPAKATQYSSIFSEYLFEVFGNVLTPAVFYPLFTIASSLLIIPLVRRCFRNHQIT